MYCRAVNPCLSHTDNLYDVDTPTCCLSGTETNRFTTGRPDGVVDEPIQFTQPEIVAVAKVMMFVVGASGHSQQIHYNKCLFYIKLQRFWGWSERSEVMAPESQQL